MLGGDDQESQIRLVPGCQTVYTVEHGALSSGKTPHGSQLLGRFNGPERKGSQACVELAEEKITR